MESSPSPTRISSNPGEATPCPLHDRYVPFPPELPVLLVVILARVMMERLTGTFLNWELACLSFGGTRTAWEESPSKIVPLPLLIIYCIYFVYLYILFYFGYSVINASDAFAAFPGHSGATSLCTCFVFLSVPVAPRHFEELTPPSPSRPNA